MRDFMENARRLVDTREHLLVRRVEKSAFENLYRTRLKALEAEQNKRNRLLSRIRNERNLKKALVKSLEEASTALNREMKTLISTPPPPPPEAPRPLSPAQKAPETPPPPPFDRQKGLLNMPVAGRIITRFNAENRKNGIDIKAERGEPIRAVDQGKVVFSEWFTGYGNMIIIDHGQGYYTIYAHAAERFKAKGDPVEKGEVIATVGDTHSVSGPRLHFEIRYHDKPIDPEKWVKKG